MTPEDIDRAIGEYEKALAWIVTQVKNDGNLLSVQGLGVAPGRISELLADIEALMAMREALRQSEGETASDE